MTIFAHNNPALAHNDPELEHKSIALAHRDPELLHLSGIGDLILLSAATVAEDAEEDTVIGTLSVAKGGEWTFTIENDPDSKFQIANDDELQLADALDFEEAAEHAVTISADNGVDAPLERTFTIAVTDVEEEE